MSSAPTSPVVEDVPLENFSSSSQDTERNVRRPSYPVKRRTTSLSTFNKQAGSRATTLNSPTLERKETLRVEDNALLGYPLLASYLAQEGYAIYRRFAALNSRNLLYHQAKLIHLEHELDSLEQEFAHQEHLHYSVRNIFHADKGAGLELRKKHEEVSAALDKYNKLLLDQERLHQLPEPDNVHVKSLATFISNQQGFPQEWLAHPEDKVYKVWNDGTPVQTDLVTINRPAHSHDPFSRFFTTKLLVWWHAIYSRLKRPETQDGSIIYPNKTLGRWMRGVVMIASSALPTCSIVVLYFIQSEIWRLIFIVIFSGVFAFALSFFTDGKNIEIFAASVALASVQVVFVGTAFGNGIGSQNG